jgi:hypothetical protein
MILDVFACETGHLNLITVPLVQSPASWFELECVHGEKTSHATAVQHYPELLVVHTAEQTTSLDKYLLCAVLLTLPLSKHRKIDSFAIRAGNGLHVGSIARYPCLPANIAYRPPRVADPDPVPGTGRGGFIGLAVCVLA